MTPAIHHALQQKHLLPDVHLVDTGDLDAELLATSRRDYQVEILGPTRLDYRWQARLDKGLLPTTSTSTGTTNERRALRAARA